MTGNTLQKKQQTFAGYVLNTAVKNQIESIVGRDAQKFTTSIITAVNQNAELQNCTYQSILSGALLGETLKLSPSPQLGQFYLVPFNDKAKGKVAQFILGYKGYIQLAIRSGQYKKINVLAIKEGELLSFDPLNEEIEVNIIQDDKIREKAKTIGYYAMFEFTNGFRKAIYWSREKMEAHAERYSAGYRAKKGFTFWEKDFDAMAYKTMLRQLISKWGIMSIEMQQAIEGDNNTINENLQPESIVQDVIIENADIKEAKTEVEAIAAELFGE